jgi:hypothetical protein
VRAAWILLCLAGCGRLGFSAREEGPADVAPDTATADCTTLPDGTPCDDRNICTDASSCQAGVCASSAVGTGCQVGDSEVEFDSTQGEGGWFYGFWLAQDDPTYQPSDFELGVFINGGYEPVDPMGAQFIYLRGFGAHPQSNPLRMPVRRWVSDVQGPALVVVEVSKSDISCGDGVEASLVVDGTLEMTKEIAFDDGDGATIPVAVELVIGTKVDALLSARTNDACDTTDYKLTIVSPPES